ncbi:RNA-guided endonuclease InsQ/TnpB family protein [Rhodothermus marinus]|uniref:RNA-guided endonuclease InsQ/TnpB family protein n=1 Tax=Rhodothermus marinus TaxID=29549 RepID=UPI0012BA427B|nr:RNA-guided endonuclease TnpB family protein [Rhodothermus marinus]BBM68806.1 transposase [Rhodothermus marinus]BBM71785.1 transposase [Rhodothermus marinus]
MQTLTLRTRLEPTPAQADALQETLECFAQACNLTLEVARACRTFSKFKLQRLVYGQLRALGLSANLAIRAIARVGHRKGHRAKHYRPTSCDYDQRTLSLRGESVSLSTTRGRLRIPMRLSPYHRYWLARARSVQGGRLRRDRRGRWYVHLTVRVAVPEALPTGRVVGVDLGQRHLAALSTGERLSGGALKTKRLHYRAKRAEVRLKLDRPSERTRSLRRLWARLSGRERRFVRQVLHEASRRIVDGLAPGDVLAIEDLRGLRGRTKRKGKARHLHQLWPYGLFRHLLEYKARLKGVRMVVVDPAHTSQTCPRCGHVDRRNRRSGRLFRCRACGFQHNADMVAALNLARRAGSEGMGRCQPAPGAIPAGGREGKPTTSVVGS